MSSFNGNYSLPPRLSQNGRLPIIQELTDLIDVDIVDPVAGEGLFWNSSSSLWTDQSVTASGIITGGSNIGVTGVTGGAIVFVTDPFSIDQINEFTPANGVIFPNDIKATGGVIESGVPTSVQGNLVLNNDGAAGEPNILLRGTGGNANIQGNSAGSVTIPDGLVTPAVLDNGADLLIINSAAAQKLSLQSLGTGVDAIEIISAGAIAGQSVGLTSFVGDKISLEGGAAAADAVKINTSSVSGGIDVDSGTAGMNFNSTGTLTFQSSKAGTALDFVSTSGTGDMMFSAGRSVDIVPNSKCTIDASAVNAQDAIKLLAEEGGIQLLAQVSTTDAKILLQTDATTADSIKLDATAGGIQLVSAGDDIELDTGSDNLVFTQLATGGATEFLTVDSAGIVGSTTGGSLKETWFGPNFFDAAFSNSTRVRNNNFQGEWTFGAGSTDYLTGTWLVPNDYTSGAPSLAWYWYSDASTTGDVVWESRSVEQTPGTVISNSLPALTSTATTTVSGTLNTINTSTLTFVSGLTPGRFVNFRVSRNGPSGSDTMSSPARFIGCRLTYA